MVWVYDRTGRSLLVTILMHASLTACSLFILAPAATGGSLVIYNLVAAAAVWVVVAVVAVLNSGQLERDGVDRTRLSSRLSTR